MHLSQHTIPPVRLIALVQCGVMVHLLLRPADAGELAGDSAVRCCPVPVGVARH